MVLIFGALLGFTSVAFGAYAEHGLRANISDEQFRFLMTAMRYHQVNAVAVTAIGLALLNGGILSKLTMLRWSGVLFAISALLFSISIYASVMLDMPELVRITPIGGMMMMAAWLSLVVVAMIARKKLKEPVSL